MVTNRWLTAPAAGMLVGFVLVLMPTQAAAHCTWGHPHHCLEEAVDEVAALVAEPLPKWAVAPNGRLVRLWGIVGLCGCDLSAIQCPADLEKSGYRLVSTSEARALMLTVGAAPALSPTTRPDVRRTREALRQTDVVFRLAVSGSVRR